jgi:hypothetical protein
MGCQERIPDPRNIPPIVSHVYPPQKGFQSSVWKPSVIIEENLSQGEWSPGKSHITIYQENCLCHANAKASPK